MIEAMKKIVAAVEEIPEDVEGWMPDALTDALIDAKKAIAIAEHDPYDDIFIAYGLPKQDNTSLDAICQDLQEMTYTQAMRIAELEAKRELVGLTDEERRIIINDWQWREGKPYHLCLSIEAKLKEKNHG